jgi:alpha-beta hydrolase superfamily lysophospholipase
MFKVRFSQKWFVISSFIIFVLFWVSFLTYRSVVGDRPLSFLSPWGGEVVEQAPRIFDQYSFPALAGREYESKIFLEKVLKEEKSFVSYLFFYLSDGKKITGHATFPKQDILKLKEGVPVVILVRGFVPEEIYKTGMGTEKMADFLASSGFITFSPDFLGFGESDLPPAVGFLSPLADRFEKVVAVLNLFYSIDGLSQTKLPFGLKVSPENVFLWGHSNGGQIALSVLEITKKPIPTVLWAPVTKPFPFNVLYFSDEVDDKGKYLRELLCGFEKDYDVDLYSIHAYFSDIAAPLQLHQGTADDSVPVSWSDDFYNEITILEKDIEYFIYEGADHNMLGGWDQAADRSLAFFKRYLKKQ